MVLLALLLCLFILGVWPTELYAQTQSRVTFGVVTDVQYCACETSGERHYSASVGKLQAAVEVLNQRDLDFVIHLGDFIDRDFSSFDTVNTIYSQITARRYHIYGNHDFSVGAGQIPAVPGVLGLDTLGTGHGYYQFSRDSWRFVVLNGTDISTYANAKFTTSYRRSEDMMAALQILGAPHARDWNGGIGAAQLAWLDQTLRGADSLGQRTILFCHFPLYPNAGYNLYNDSQVLHLLDQHPSVTAYFNGHHHAGMYGNRRGVHYVTFRGMVNTTETAFAVVTLTPQNIRIEGFGREPNRMLPITASDQTTE